MAKQSVKIKELKAQIKNEQNTLADAIIILGPEATQEERDEQGKKNKDTIAIKRAEITSLKGELALIRMNKTGSSFFEWHPHKGMNRRQARAFRKQMQHK